MQIASEYVVFNHKLSDQQLLECIQGLKQMFAGGICQIFQNCFRQLLFQNQIIFQLANFGSGKWNNHKWEGRSC